ncbi:MAG: hypothetical protein AB1603_02455 [Chloroflexota bacterium]
MDVTLLSQVLLGLSSAVALTGVAFWLASLMARARILDLAPEKGSARAGVVYALTVGMMPWKKESTRKHWVDYLRGILFHVGAFAGIIVVLLSLWWGDGPLAYRLLFGAAVAIGLVAGVLGLLVRVSNDNLRALSRADDYISPALVTAFLLAALGFLLGAWSRAAFYLVTSVVLLYLPFSKVRHCVYFFFSRSYFGNLFGRRGVMGFTHGNGLEGRG